MTNITLSIDSKIYSKMKSYSEIKWSEFVRKMIEMRINELDLINRDNNKEGIFSMLASEQVLAKDWNNEKDSRWDSI